MYKRQGEGFGLAAHGVSGVGVGVVGKGDVIAGLGERQHRRRANAPAAWR